MLGDNIKAMREEAGHTQLDLAKKLGISRTSVTAWENGTSCPSATYLIELSKLYGRSVDFILGLENKETIRLDGFTNHEKELLVHIWQYINSKKTD